MVFMKDWYQSIIDDEYVETSEQEMSYILYAAMQYCFTGEKINLGEVFGAEFKGLNRSMPNIYSQIDKIMSYNEKQGKKNQKYDNDAVEKLAARGLSQKEICRELGYDEKKSNSLSSNAGYKRGRAQFLNENSQFSTEIDSFNKTVKNCQNSVQNCERTVKKTVESNDDSFIKNCDSSMKTFNIF